jgi:hypothetical protein
MYPRVVSITAYTLASAPGLVNAAVFRDVRSRARPRVNLHLQMTDTPSAV